MQNLPLAAAERRTMRPGSGCSGAAGFGSRQDALEARVTPAGSAA